MDSQNDSPAFEPVSHPLAFPTQKNNAVNNVYAEAAARSPRADSDAHDPQEASRSFEMGDGVLDNDNAPADFSTPAAAATASPIIIRTTVPGAATTHHRAGGSSKSASSVEQQSATVHIDPRRSHTVAAQKAAEAEAEAEPLTAENETWGHWSFRHTWNAIVMVLLGLYQVTQAGARRQPVDMKTITYTNSVYMEAPPRAAELQKTGGAANGTTEAAP